MSDYNPILARSIERKLSEAREVIKRALVTRNIPMLWGASGVGKTEMIEDLIKSIPNCRQITLSLSNRDPLDFTGIPSLEGGRTITNDPTLVPLATDSLGVDENGDEYTSVIVYIDELPEGDTPTLKAIYRLLNERMVNNSPVHPQVGFIASGNPSSVGAQTEKLIPTVANRMMHISVKVCHLEWLGWATRKGVSPVHRAFIASNPQMLNTYKEDAEEDAFATPRTHARLHAYMQGDKFTDKTLIAQGAPVQFLGKKAGLALLDFAEATDLPPLQDILRDPQGFDIKALKPGSIHLLGQSLISAATETNIEAVLQVMARMADNYKAINFMGLTNLPRTQLFSLMKNPVFAKFTADNFNLLTIVKSAQK